MLLLLVVIVVGAAVGVHHDILIFVPSHACGVRVCCCGMDLISQFVGISWGAQQLSVESKK